MCASKCDWFGHRGLQHDGFLAMPKTYDVSAHCISRRLFDVGLRYAATDRVERLATVELLTEGFVSRLHFGEAAHQLDAYRLGCGVARLAGISVPAGATSRFLAGKGVRP